MPGCDYSFITPSYRNDYAIARHLCESMDAFVQGRFEHILVVPRRDLKLFRDLESAHRRLLTVESVVGQRGFIRVPFPTRIGLGGVTLYAGRELWFHPHAGLMTGWSLQQIVKLSAPDYAQAEVLVYVDSDVEFFRKFDPRSLSQDGLLKLHKHTRGATRETHQAWRLAAKQLLHLAEGCDADAVNYIGNIVPWTKSNLVSLQQRLTQANGRVWWIALAQRRFFSEYILYGMFCEKHLGAASNSLPLDIGLYNSIWNKDEYLRNHGFVEEMKASHVALHIQSTSKIDPQTRRKIVADAIAQYRESELAGAPPQG
jgi:hypothetical protein